MSKRTATRPLGLRTVLLATLAMLALVWGVNQLRTATTSRADAAAASKSEAGVPVTMWTGAASWQKPSDEDLRTNLSDLQYRVTQADATERAFQNEYWNNRDHGIYVDVVSGEPLFSSLHKYKSGTGWPSFDRPLVDLSENTDHHLGYPRTEVRSKVADSHLGHVFPDGPATTGKQYCINSAALVFVPVADLAANGYEEFVPAFREAGIEITQTEVAYLAGGCYWGMEDLIRDVPGVVDTEVGFTGGAIENPTYEDLRAGDSGHAEAIRVEYDSSKLSYEELLDFFFRIHDPTTPNRQGNDRGSQYRSAIFVANDAQRATAERVKAEWDASGRWGRPIVTQIAAAGPFSPAKEGHQDYLEKYPDGYTCHFLREWDE